MRLTEAVANRDTTYLYSVVSEDMLTSFGGNGGIQEFKEFWKPESKYSELWGVQGYIVGSVIYNNGTFSTPYYSANFPSDLDPFAYGVPLGNKVTVFDKPDRRSNIIDTLQYDIIHIPEYFSQLSENSLWLNIKLPNNQTGFVTKSMIGSPLDYRAQFEKYNGSWKLTVLIASD